MRRIVCQCRVSIVVTVAALQVCAAEAESGSVAAAPQLALDLDCLGDVFADEVIEDLVKLTGSLHYYALTGSVKASGWQGWHREHEVWRSYVRHVFRRDAAGEAAGLPALALRCPPAAEALGLARWGACFLAGAGPAAGGYIRHMGCFRRTGVFAAAASGRRIHSHLFCAKACSGRDYFALESGGKCLCDEHFQFSPDVEERVLDSKCGGAFGSGAFQFISVYALSVPPPPSGATPEEIPSECNSFHLDLGARFRSLVLSPAQSHEALSGFARSRFAQPVLQFLSSLRIQVQARPSLLDPEGIARRALDCPVALRPQELRPQAALDDVRRGWSVARVAAEAARAAKRLASPAAKTAEAHGRCGRGAAATTWPAYLAALTSRMPTESWLHSQALRQDQHQRSEECVMGYLTLMLEQLVAAQAGRTEDRYIRASSAVETFLKLQLHAERMGALAMAEGGRVDRPPLDSLTLLLLTRWPALQFFIAFATEETAAGAHSLAAT